MRRTLFLLGATLLVLLPAGCNKKKTPEPPPGSATTAKPEPEKIAAAGQVLEGFHGLRIVKGGRLGGPPHGGTGMLIAQYAMPRDALASATIALINADGWTIARNTRSPRGSVRLVVAKDGNRVSVRIAGRGGRAALIISKLRAPMHKPAG